MEDLPYPYKHFDIILFNRVLQHIRPKELEGILKKATQLGKSIFINEMMGEQKQLGFYIYIHQYKEILNEMGWEVIESYPIKDGHELLFQQIAP